MKRKLLLDHLRSAGYYGDHAKWTRLYVENRISNSAAMAAWDEGAARRRQRDGSGRGPSLVETTEALRTIKGTLS